MIPFNRAFLYKRSRFHSLTQPDLQNPPASALSLHFFGAKTGSVSKDKKKTLELYNIPTSCCIPQE
jgi:hypothetical protein